MTQSQVLTASPHTRTAHVGTYRRVLPVSLERMFENTLDWEHLPWQHASSFDSIVCEDAGEWGWRARTTSPRNPAEATIELRFDRSCGRWVTTNLAGPNAGAEIWTYAWPRAEREIEVIVDFFVPDIAAEHRDRVGAAYARSYATLYDEDEEMMVGRQQQLDHQFSRSDADLCLGKVDQLSFPVEVEWHGRGWVIEEVGSTLQARAQRCPHQLGPLQREGDALVCPWHGYRFDPTSGNCISGQACRLPPAPRLSIRDGLAWISGGVAAQ